MHIFNGSLTFSASDLSNYLACRHLSHLDRNVAEGTLDAPTWRDPGLVLLQRRGLAHEQAYVDHLRAHGLQLVDLRQVEEGDSALEKTLHAMDDGVDGIIQGALQHGAWSGRADLLMRVESPSDLGPWSYEVVDTKLAQQTRGGTVLQLALYTELLGHHLGRLPEHMHVVKPGPDLPRDSFRWDDFAAYFRRLRKDFEGAVAAATDPQASAPKTYPLPVPQCDICRWWSRCDRQRRRDDHLSLVAGMRNLQIGELERQGMATLEDFATRTAPLAPPRQGSIETYTQLQRQAQVQLEGRRRGEPHYAFRPQTDAEPWASTSQGAPPARGLARLPAPSPGDIFFDFEADPFVGDGGLEYLFGFAIEDEDGDYDYRSLWALNRHQEQQAFEGFIDFVTARLETFPDLHIYHFSPYEPSALKRLMGRFGSREEALDRLLRGERFVDLLAVTRQSLWASVERYSLKELEPFYAFRRQLDLADASLALRRIAWALEVGTPEDISVEDRRGVETYNREDCLSTAALRSWLEQRREEWIADGGDAPRPETPEDTASEDLQEQQAEIRGIFEGLMSGLPDDEGSTSDDDHAGRLLAHLLDYFRREEKSAWWEFFRLRDLDDHRLLVERKAVAGLAYVETVPATSGRLPIHRYRFPEQEMAVRVGHRVCAPGGVDVGQVQAVDLANRTLDLRKRGDTIDFHPPAVFSKEVVGSRPLDTSLLQLGRSVVEHGIDGEGPHRAARDLLLRRPPRRASSQARPESAPLRLADEPLLTAAYRLVDEMDGGVLPVQGPPGTGKTYLGARLIVHLVRQGKRVGVTAVSHKVIRNLLEKALAAAAEQGVTLEAAHKPGSKRPGEPVAELPEGLIESRKTDLALAQVGERVVGGTAWLWANDQACDLLDVLIVDEAGQMSLAHVLAAARSARNLVLLGDPQQLEQPQKGTHPQGADAAALEHLLDGRPTLPPHRGLFLDQTWRLSPTLCDLTSELYYEGRLGSHPSLEAQRIDTSSAFDGGGLFYVPVPHHGNQASAPEEVEAVAYVVEQLLGNPASWVDGRGRRQALGDQDILVVAPFNAQVGALHGRLPDLRIGTVDRFQGQEAAVVIYSLTSSSIEEAPRGMSFLFDPHRLNVATSRARCAVILVASPRLFEAECRTPEQMRWANGLCRFRELADEVTV